MSDWRSIQDAPPHGEAVRLRGKWWDGKRYERDGFFDAYEGIWIECMDGPDANALSSYPDDKNKFGPTHWRPLVKEDDKRIERQTMQDLIR